MREERGGWIAIASSKRVRTHSLNTIREFKALSFENFERGENEGGLPSPVIREFKTLNSEIIINNKALSFKRVEWGEKGGGLPSLTIRKLKIMN